MHVVGHEVATPLQTYGAQLGLPALPADAIVHVPGVRSQRSHPPPLHADEQHTPDAQKPDWH